MKLKALDLATKHHSGEAAIDIAILYEQYLTGSDGNVDRLGNFLMKNFKDDLDDNLNIIDNAISILGDYLELGIRLNKGE